MADNKPNAFPPMAEGDPNVLPPEGDPNAATGSPEPKLDPKPEVALPPKGVVWSKPPCALPWRADPKPLGCGFEGRPNSAGSKLYFFAKFLNKSSSLFLYFINTLSTSLSLEGLYFW
jgi:hypothetical protein